ncbi:hypothetical protein G4B88_002202 [Cannabis sativa]|uniref:Protein kinase domain-containing protein n=2 Tax=Cannabis sativa TaxID=3483 RepID=A0A7J6FYT1_CANSA|nr:hypothetical protein G4B88_002202 [Cannabis sativa]
MIMKKSGREKEEKSLLKRIQRWGWMRGRLLGVGTHGSVFEAIIHGKTDSRPLQFKDYPSLLVVKSANSDSYYGELIIEKEEFVYTSLGSNPHIIKFYGHDYTFSKDHDGGNYGRVRYNLFFENALGGSLSDFIKRTRGWLRESQARAHTRSILKGLEFIHQKGFVHCDIKPSNILLVHCDDNNPHGVDGPVAKIADFGLSKRINDDSESGNKVTGSWLYLSPENVCEETQDQASDIWALGDPNQRPSAQMLLDHPFAMKIKEEDFEEEDPEEEDSEEEDLEEEDPKEKDPEEDPEEDPKEDSKKS